MPEEVLYTGPGSARGGISGGVIFVGQFYKPYSAAPRNVKMPVVL